MGRKAKLLQRDKQLQEPMLIDFARALWIFKMNNPEKALVLKDKDVIKIFASKRIPRLVAPQTEWDKVFREF